MKIIFIQQAKDFYKIIVGIILLLLFSFSPIILAMVGGYFEEIIRGVPVHEGNSVFVSFGWFFLITIPAGAILLIVWLVISVCNIWNFIKNRN